jgi:hypothetical protein
VSVGDRLDPIGRWRIEIVKRCDAVEGFVVLPRRWVVERTFAWLNRNRRLAKDFEASRKSALRLVVPRQRQTTGAESGQTSTSSCIMVKLLDMVGE